MTTRGVDQSSDTQSARGAVTLREIRQQPDLWPSTLERVSTSRVRPLIDDRTAIICGAGTSAYAASAVASSWSNALAIPTTDLVSYSKQDVARLVPGFATRGTLVSLARSGDSPESVGTVVRLQKLFPEAKHIAITCNEKGQLAHSPASNPSCFTL